MSEGSHGFPKRPAGFLVIQRRLCSGHTVILAVMRKVCNGLDQQLIVASDHPLIVHTGRLGNHLAGILRTKIPLDGLNIALTFAADDSGYGLCGFYIAISGAGLRREACTGQILQLIDFSKMKHIILRPIGKVNWRGYRSTALCIYDRNSDTIIARNPFVT